MSLFVIIPSSLDILTFIFFNLKTYYVKFFQLQEVLLYILMSKIKELIQMDADSWFQNCCKERRWVIDFDDVICTNCGRVLTDRIEAIAVVA
jgi:hypothetical protein